MKVAFDSSVLVAALVQSHVRHQRAIIWLDAAIDGHLQGLGSWHAIAETWSVLTRLPLKPRLSAERAWLVVGRLRDHLTLIEPRSEIYEVALSRCASKGHISGVVFDAIHLVTAEASKADVMLTFNPKDFHRLREPSSPQVVVPPDPPSLETNEPSPDHGDGG